MFIVQLKTKHTDIKKKKDKWEYKAKYDGCLVECGERSYWIRMGGVGGWVVGACKVLDRV